MTVQNLIRFNKPVILKANYRYTAMEQVYITFTNLRPYKQGVEKVRRICDHANFFQTDILKLYGEFWNHNLPPYQAVYLVCRPYIYFGENWQKRGGFCLTDELDIPPIQLTDVFIKDIPQERYVDFAEFALGKYLCPKKATKKRKKRTRLVVMNKSKRRRAKERRAIHEHQKNSNARHVEELLKMLEQNN